MNSNQASSTGKTFVLLFAIWGIVPDIAEAQWKRHTIDSSSKGADGVRLGDFNGDGFQDVVTGWEEGGIVRVYENPGVENVRRPWPSVTVGKAPSVEDALFVDLDRDGNLDVVSCCEGKERTVFVHWAPAKAEDYLQAAAWKTESIPATRKKNSWMFAVPFDIDGQNGPDLFVGSKGTKAVVGWLESPANPRELEKWTFHKLESAGWIMSMRLFDVDRDGRKELLISDRKGKDRSVYYLRQDQANAKRWTRVNLHEKKFEYMFMDAIQLGESTRYAIATRNGQVVMIEHEPRSRRETKIPNPFGVQNGKAVAWGDIDLDGELDIVHTANTGARPASPGKPGVCWMKRDAKRWKSTSISGAAGRKFDRIELIDLDRDGDLDVLTCEEVDQLGVIWYENPIKP